MIILTSLCRSFYQIRQYSKYRYRKVPKRLQNREIEISKIIFNGFRRGMIIETNDEDRKQESYGQKEEVLKQTISRYLFIDYHLFNSLPPLRTTERA